MKNPLDLTGCTILVTGASSGIGRASAVLLGELGAKVILNGRTAERLVPILSILEGEGHRAEPFDLSLSDGIPKWLQSITAETGPLRGIIHAAGKQVTLPIRGTTEAKLDDLFRTNVHSALLLARAFAQKGCAQADASLVFLSSVTAFASKPGISAYAGTKAALQGIAKALALELAPRIRVNCVAPAFVQTEMFEQLREVLTEEQLQALEAEHPLGFGTPEDVAHAAAFLVSRASRWVTGTTLVIDGGYSAH